MSSPNAPEACHGSLRPQRALEDKPARAPLPPDDENAPLPRSSAAPPPPQRGGRAAILSKHPGMAAGARRLPLRALSSNVPGGGPRLAVKHSTQDSGVATATAQHQQPPPAAETSSAQSGAAAGSSALPLQEPATASSPAQSCSSSCDDATVQPSSAYARMLASLPTDTAAAATSSGAAGTPRPARAAAASKQSILHAFRAAVGGAQATRGGGSRPGHAAHDTPGLGPRGGSVLQQVQTARGISTGTALGPLTSALAAAPPDHSSRMVAARSSASPSSSAGSCTADSDGSAGSAFEPRGGGRASASLPPGPPALSHGYHRAVLPWPRPPQPLAVSGAGFLRAIASTAVSAGSSSSTNAAPSAGGGGRTWLQQLEAEYWQQRQQAHGHAHSHVPGRCSLSGGAAASATAGPLHAHLHHPPASLAVGPLHQARAGASASAQGGLSSSSSVAGLRQRVRALAVTTACPSNKHPATAGDSSPQASAGQGGAGHKPASDRSPAALSAPGSPSSCSSGSVDDTAQSRLSYALPAHLLRSPFVGVGGAAADDYVRDLIERYQGRGPHAPYPALLLKRDSVSRRATRTRRRLTYA